MASVPTQNLMAASHQWATRPNDERFISLTELHEHTQRQRSRSVGKVLSSRALEAHPVEKDHQALVVVGPNGTPATMTHWSFGQLASRAGAPAGYLRGLPTALAADCLNYGLKFHRDVEDLGVLLYKDAEAGAPVLRAVTGPNYGRVWNSTITGGLVKRFGDGLTGDFRIPGEFGQRVPITKDNTTLYASDRDMFVFLADEEHRIEVPDRRAGKHGDFARGFFIWNSETGAGKIGLALFLFDYACSNRIVWGATEYREISFRHSSGAPDRYLEEMTPAIEAYAKASAKPVVAAIQAAQQKRVENLDEFLRNRRFSNSQIGSIKAAHMADEQRPIETLWDVATGITAYARSIAFQDARVDLEREAGKVLDLAA